jgi:D-3-phosphoglycerate dehydrogenase
LVKHLAGFDCRIVAFDPYADAMFAKDHQVELVSMEEVIRLADFISLHLPLLPLGI